MEAIAPVKPALFLSINIENQTSLRRTKRIKLDEHQKSTVCFALLSP